VSGLIGYAKWLLDAEGDRCKAKKIVDAMNKQSNKRKRGIHTTDAAITNRNVIKNIEAGRV
jgi:hypothetical protein